MRALAAELAGVLEAEWKEEVDLVTVADPCVGGLDSVVGGELVCDVGDEE